jgi:Fe-S cluster assembly iron-binding protein IscA
MLTVTDGARKQLKEILSGKVDNPLAGLRLTHSSPGEFALNVDIELPCDQVVEHEGSKVLLVEQALADSLDGVTLDVQDTADGPELIVLTE